MNDNTSNIIYNDKFYNDQIKFYKNLLKNGDDDAKSKAEKALLNLRGKLQFELRQANKQINKILNGKKVNGVVSDMAADTTGHRPTDHLRTTMLLESAIDIAKDFLDEDGFFLGKCFKGGAEASVLETLNKLFKVVKHVKPDASRKESVESYVLAMHYKNKT